MVDLLKSIVGTFLRGQFHVQIVNTSDYTRLVLSDPPLYLYNEKSQFYAILRLQAASSKAFSLFNLRDEGEAHGVFNCYRQRLLQLITPIPHNLDCDLLKTICDCLREHPQWSVAHVAAYAGLVDAFKNAEIIRSINTQSLASGTTPLMVAVENNNLQCVTAMLLNGADRSLVDKDGNTIFHYATHSKDVIKLLGISSQSNAINMRNSKCETPLYQCCEQNSLECTQAFLEIGADPYQMTYGMAPIHIALKKGETGLIKLLCKFDKGLAILQEQKYGGYPIHWIHEEEHITILKQYGCNLNAISTHNHRSALHVMLAKNRLNCAMALLCQGINPNTKDIYGNTALHMAVLKPNINLVRSLIIFGANLNEQNNSRHTARHLAALIKSDVGHEIVHILNESGAARCGNDVSGCFGGCVAGGSYNGFMKTKHLVNNVKDDSDAAFSELLIGRVLPKRDTNVRGSRLLCLDGGGVKGLITIQMLIEIEKLVGKPIQECFDWIAGTSTGGILALAIAQGKSLMYCKSLYFRMKNEIFCGKRPYSSEKLEQVLKEEFGEHTVMADLKKPKVIVTTAIADQIPPKLHLFQNYTYSLTLPNNKQHQPDKTPIQSQKVWHAARCSGAAPTFFRSCGKYLDGGLMSNNPTLDALTEIHHYNLAMEQNNLPIQPIDCVVSLGTGRAPTVKINSMDVFLPENVFDLAICAVRSLALKDLIVHQVTNTDDQPVQQARSWCSMLNIPYFRFNPPQSEDLSLDCHDSEKIIDMMWETMCYCNANKSKFQSLANILHNS